MAGGRGHTPLFDLLRDADRAEFQRRTAANARTGAPPITEPKPATRSSPPAASHQPTPPAAERARATAPVSTPTDTTALPEPDAVSETWFDARRIIAIPLMHVGTLVAAALAVTIVVWYVAFSAGKSSAERRLQPFVTGQQKPQPPVDDPLRQNSNGTSLAPEPPVAGVAGNNSGSREPVHTPSKPDRTAAGRVAGQNYLILAESLPCEDAATAVAFLVSEGFPAASAPIDRAGSRANNGPRCVVFSTLGIPGEEYSKQWKLRGEHAKEARRLGALWKRDHRGTSDFAQAYWAKYLPDSR